MEILETESLVLHPEALATPRMNVEQFEALKDHIDKHGQLEPVTTYRGKIVDGRHRWLVLQELGIGTIKAVKMANNSTLQQIKDVVIGKETRRHETASQLAIRAYKHILGSTDKISQAEAAKMFGANVKRISEAKKIAVTYNRPDILELLFDGEKFNTGTTDIPFLTDSLGTILRWLADNWTIKNSEVQIGLEPRTELTETEQLIVNKFLAVLKKESEIVRTEVIKVGYAMLKEGNE